MIIRDHGNNIELTADGSRNPDTLIINGELAHCFGGYPTSNGTHLYYETASGKKYSVENSRLMHVFEDELREAVSATGKSLREVAELIGVQYSVMQAYRSGKSYPNASTRVSILNSISALTKEEAK